ncbi:MAG: hypothetical protein HDQ89_02335 [Desulfovibrio sp.]|nr:hypothetical protein [Desulfovibrio sp.]
MLFQWPATLSRQGSAFPELFAVVGNRVPDLRGYFLRGLGGNSAALGVSQGDAIRNIEGDMGRMPPSTNVGGNPESGAFATYKYANDGGFYPSATARHMNFSAARVVPTANENRPLNKAVRYLIRARP